MNRSQSQLSGGECVKVVVRCRPQSKNEAAANLRSVVSVVQSVKQIEVEDPRASGPDGRKSFSFDAVFDADSTQKQVGKERISMSNKDCCQKRLLNSSVCISRYVSLLCRYTMAALATWLQASCSVTMELFLLMGRLVQERHTRWKVVQTKLQKASFPNHSTIYLDTYKVKAAQSNFWCAWSGATFWVPGFVSY